MNSGEKIRGMMKLRDLSVAALAAKAGLSRPWVDSAQKGGNLGIKAIMRLASALEVTVDYLARDRDSDSSDFTVVSFEQSLLCFCSEKGLYGDEMNLLRDTGLRAALKPCCLRDWSMIYDGMHQQRMGPRAAG